MNYYRTLRNSQILPGDKILIIFIVWDTIILDQILHNIKRWIKRKGSLLSLTTKQDILVLLILMERVQDTCAERHGILQTDRVPKQGGFFSPPSPARTWVGWVDCDSKPPLIQLWFVWGQLNPHCFIIPAWRRKLGEYYAFSICFLGHGFEESKKHPVHFFKSQDLKIWRSSCACFSLPIVYGSMLLVFVQWIYFIGIWGHKM